MKAKLCLIICFAASFGYAQLFNIRQTNSAAAGGNNMMGIYGKHFTAYKNFLVAYDDMMGNKFLAKFNAQGDTVYVRKRDNSYTMNDLTECADGSVYTCFVYNGDIIVNKNTPQGQRAWEKKLTLPAGGSWSDVVAHGYNTDVIFFVGSSYWPAGGHAMIGRLDSTGTPSFFKSIDMSSVFDSTTYDVNPLMVRVTSGGNLLFLGSTYANSGSPMYLFVMLTDATGNILWTKTYPTGVGGGQQTFYGSSLALTSNDEILIGGYRQSSNTNSAYMRLDSSGNFLWGKYVADIVYGGAELAPLSSGDLALHMANSNQVPDAIPKNLISILDANGNVKLTRSFGYAVTNNTGGIGQDASGNIVAMGYYGSNQELYFYNIDTAGAAVGCHDIIASLPVTSFTASFASQSFTAVTETYTGPTSNPVTALTTGSFNKTTSSMQTNGAATAPLCYGTFGSVSLNPSGGSSPYAFSWSNGTSSQNLLNVPGGVYTVRMSDNTGCVAVDTFNVIEPPQLAATFTVSHVTCFGAQNGSINVTTAGGTPGYNFQWTTQATTEDILGLSGGFYQLTITDTNGCTKQLAVSVNEPQQLVAGISASQNVTCNGACNGSLTGIASGGTQPYTYQWNDAGNSTTATIGSLCPGNYLFSVTDAKNCSTFANAVITEPAALALSTATAPAQCGMANGAASAAVTGGVPPYAYAWSSGSLNDTASSLLAGTYTVNVLDANNCPISSAVTLGLTTPAPDICLVTVDSLSTHNILVWDKTPFTNIDYFNIYREDITNSYSLIGAVDYDSLSEYHDYDMNMADPNITTKRYKISAVDTCGNESNKSNYHNTIFISQNNGTFTWNTYTIQNSANPVTSYRLMRDDFATGNWQQIGTTAGTQNVLNDPNYATYQNTADWRVETIWNISCTSTVRKPLDVMGAVVKSKSNITNNRVAGTHELAAGAFAIYPNPASEAFTILLTGAQHATAVEIINSLGQVVHKEMLSGTQSTLYVAHLANGIYQVRMISGEHSVGMSKLVVQR